MLLKNGHVFAFEKYICKNDFRSFYLFKIKRSSFYIKNMMTYLRQQNEKRRFLSKEEKDDILSNIVLDGNRDFESAVELLKNIRGQLESQLNNIQIYPCKIPELKTVILKHYRESRTHSGQMVGCLAALSVGEPSTQMTLNTFHFSGVSSFGTSSMGIQRMNELLNLSKKQKFSSVLIQLKNQSCVLKDVRKVCKKMFEERCVGDFLEFFPTMQNSVFYKNTSNYEQKNLSNKQKNLSNHEQTFLYSEPKNLSNREQEWYRMFDLTMKTKEYCNLNWCLRLRISKLILLQYDQTLKNLSQIIESQLQDCVCVFSPDCLGIIDVYINTDEIEDASVIFNMIKQKKTVKIASCRNDMTDLIKDENKIFFFMRDVVIPSIAKIKVSGITGIKNVVYRKEFKKNGWILETIGTNLRDVLNHPLVDHQITKSNNVWEIYRIFGVEASRNFLIEEFRKTISASSSSVDPIHLGLLIDSMTCRGVLSSVSRNGIGRDVGPLAKASFEQSSKNMAISATRGETESLENVSSSIIMGKIAKIGSGVMTLLPDMKMLKSQNQLHLEQENKLNFSEEELSLMIQDGKY